MQEVGRVVLYSQGSFSRVRIWYSGWIPNINGLFTRGWRGEKLTMITRDIIQPVGTFYVKEVLREMA